MNTHFAIAVHILVFIAEQGGTPVTSTTVAGSVGTNPSFVRRIVAQLGRAGLTTATEGAGGGTVLARPAEAITLRDVYHAVDETRELVPLHPSPHPMCKIGRNIKGVLGSTVRQVEETVDTQLDRTTIADLLADVVRREQEREAAMARG
ncbi:Rrf2 family transcriptional regulator [Roseisolibacter sp. H3M3-2]|uniref:RrF2 family transcriptional regulator n=1 Tax=Roseisolibacter sp. H3M3-2 TaxID=3031323 RepID=UPI0023DA3914|nr:Rrf2 family transcriptional regulator [Roseisolibacter sp. H3M3-2]MDF1502274.1 Rrf2 family transcriptional regulator [Roseisolibacter sp. H3M3-2]